MFTISRNKLFDSLIKPLYFFLRFPRYFLAIAVPSQHGESTALSLSFTLQIVSLKMTNALKSEWKHKGTQVICSEVDRSLSKATVCIFPSMQSPLFVDHA